MGNNVGTSPYIIGRSQGVEGRKRQERFTFLFVNPGKISVSFILPFSALHDNPLSQLRQVHVIHER